MPAFSHDLCKYLKKKTIKNRAVSQFIQTSAVALTQAYITVINKCKLSPSSGTTFLICTSRECRNWCGRPMCWKSRKNIRFSQNNWVANLPYTWAIRPTTHQNFLGSVDQNGNCKCWTIRQLKTKFDIWGSKNFYAGKSSFRSSTTGYND